MEEENLSSCPRAGASAQQIPDSWVLNFTLLLLSENHVCAQQPKSLGQKGGHAPGAPALVSFGPESAFD
jgi:hypothetical protein